MFFRVLRYDFYQTAKPMSAAYAAAFGFALLARLGIFSLTDMPLVYLLFFGSIGILIYRYRRTMFGVEATLLFSTTLRAHSHIFVRLFSFFLYSSITTVITATALMVQGESLGLMIASLPAFHAILLYFEVTFSLFFLTIQITAVLTLANMPHSRNKGGVGIILYACLYFGAIAILASLTEPLLPDFVVLSATEGLFISKSHIHASSIALSLNSLFWIAIAAPLSVGLMIKITHSRLLITG